MKPPVFVQRITQDFAPASVLVIGSSPYSLVQSFRMKGIEAFGMGLPEGKNDELPKIQPAYSIQDSLAAPLARSFDLVIAFNALERLPKEQAEQAIPNICACTQQVLFAIAPYEYKDASLLNVQPPEYWSEQFARSAFFRDVEYDASYVSPWAACFRRSASPLHEIVRNYERRYWLLSKENQDLRALEAETRQQKGELEQGLKAFLKDKEHMRIALNAQIRALTKQVIDLTKQVNVQSRQILEWHEHWTSVQSGMTWRILQAAIRIQPVLAPQGSRRHRFLLWMFNSIRTLVRRLAGKPRIEIPEERPAAPTEGSEKPTAPSRQTGRTGRKKVKDQPASPFVLKRKALKLALYSNDPWTSACAHLRLIGPAQYPASGIFVMEGTRWESRSTLRFHSDADALVIQRDFPRQKDLYQQVIEWAQTKGKPVIYELDDLLIELPDEHPEQAYYAEARLPMLSALSSANAVVVSTQALANYARRFNANTWVLPNYLDGQHWTQPQSVSKGKGPVVIGYMGGLTRTHLPDLELVTPLLQRLLWRYKEKIRLRFWGLVPDELKDLPNVEYLAEKFSNYLEFARYFSHQSCDLFIAPLRDSLFNRCKSAIKFIEYSWLGIPGVYSHIEPYQGVVASGANGFLAADESEWDLYLSRLIEDSELRKDLGRNARQTVQDYFLMSRHAHEWGTVYRAAITAGRNPMPPNALVDMQLDQWQKNL